MSCQLSLSRIEPTDTLNYVQTTEHRLSSLATAHRCSASQFLYTSCFIGFMSVCRDTERGGCRLQLHSAATKRAPKYKFWCGFLAHTLSHSSLTRCEFLDGLPWEIFISKPEMNWGNSKPCYENICRVFYGVCALWAAAAIQRNNKFFIRKGKNDEKKTQSHQTRTARIQMNVRTNIN